MVCVQRQATTNICCIIKKSFSLSAESFRDGLLAVGVRRIKIRTYTERRDKDKSPERKGHYGHNKYEKINMVWTCPKNAG